jgi:hypothetical protein
VELYRAGQRLRVSILESGGLVEADPVLAIDGDYTVESEHRVVVVEVKRTPEAMREGTMMRIVVVLMGSGRTTYHDR